MTCVLRRMFDTFLRISLLAALFVCGAFPGYSQTGTPSRLSPNDAVEMAIKNNLNLEAARIGLDMKKRKVDKVWNEFLPTLLVTGTMSRDNWASSASGTAPVPFPLNPLFGSPPNLPDIYGVTSYSMDLPQWHVIGNFSAELTFSFALIEGIKSIKLDYQAGLLGYEKAKLQIEQGIRKMYNSILLIEANATLLKETYDNAQRQAGIAEANFRAGLAPRLAWLQAQVAVENMKPAINELENSLKSLKGNFALLLGLSYDATFELESLDIGSEYIPPDVEELISKAASGKPDIQELYAAINTLQAQRKAMRLQAFTPFLRLGWTLSSMFNPMLDPFKESWFNADNWTKGGNFSFTLGWSLNSLFPFTKEGQQRADMESGIQIQHIMISQKIKETELEVFTKINSLEKIRASKDAQQAAVDLAEQSYRLTEEAYNAGLQDFQAVRSAALALEQAKLQLLTQQYNYLNDLIDLEYSIGVPFGTLSSSGTSGNGSAK